MTNYFNYEPIFTEVFTRSNLPRKKYGAYAIHINDKNSKGTQWISLFNDRNAAAYFDSSGIEYIRLEV